MSRQPDHEGQAAAIIEPSFLASIFGTLLSSQVSDAHRSLIFRSCPGQPF
jgi:hypothetical protein